jgi:hypothetical protein
VKSKAVLVSHEPSAGRPASGYSWTAQHVKGSGRSSCSFVRRLIVQAAAGCPRLEFPGARLKKGLPARELMSLFDMVRVPAEPPQCWLDFRGACFRPDVGRMVSRGHDLLSACDTHINKPKATLRKEILIRPPRSDRWGGLMPMTTECPCICGALRAQHKSYLDN